MRSLRLVVYWNDVAPQNDSRSRPRVDLRDPDAYAWGEYDNVMRAAREHGFEVVPTLTLPGPRWAMRERDDHLSYPDADLFGAFVEAIARRYGDEVDAWAIGNEPNHPDFLRPQYRRGEAVSPRLYRQLYREATAALDRSGNRNDTKVLGEMLPRGKRGTSVAPLAFLRSVLCLDRRYRKLKSRRCGRLDIDAVSHHPYTVGAVGPFFVSPRRDDVTIGSLSRLTRALDKAARAGVVRRSMPIWLTEFGVQSTPDRIVGVSLDKQVEHRAMSEWIAWRNPRVKMFSQYLLTDDPPVEGVSARRRYEGFESGLRFSTGADKPSLAAFPLTISAQRTRRGVSLWGVVRPATGPTRAEIVYQNPGSRQVRRLKTVTTDARGFFTTTTSYRTGRRYRLRWENRQGAPVGVMRRP